MIYWWVEPCLTFSSDLLALHKKHLHSRVSQLLARQVRFGEHDREWEALTLIGFSSRLFSHQLFNDLVQAKRSMLTADNNTSFSCFCSALIVCTLEVFHQGIICDPLCIASRSISRCIAATGSIQEQNYDVISCLNSWFDQRFKKKTCVRCKCLSLIFYEYSLKCNACCCYRVEWCPQSNPEDQLGHVQPGPDSHLHPALPGLHWVRLLLKLNPSWKL